MDQRLQVRLKSPWTTRMETETAVFSVDIPAEKADALLSEWAPDPELFTFPRRKAWYCCEPQCQFRGLGGGTWPKIKAELGPDEFLWHGHPDERYRVPHITHFEPLVMNTNQDRMDKAIAIVSNHGGLPWRRHPDIAYRNRLITHPDVDLYGRRGWTRYRQRWYSWPKAPANYKGEIPGDWPAAGKRELMSGYKVAICLENMCEPHYFTEKLVEAVVAGCLPIYRANQDLKPTVLCGARWIDPQNYTGPPDTAISDALRSEAEAVIAQNLQWLQENKHLALTHSQRVFERIGHILGNN
jgi:hypothetical protein